VFHIAEDFLAKVTEGFEVGFAYLAQKESFEAGHALAIVETDLSDEPVRFTSSASAAISDFSGAVIEITKTSGSTGGKLAFVEGAPAASEVLDLIRRAAEAAGHFDEGSEVRYSVHKLLG
jgi:hypothetical protein